MRFGIAISALHTLAACHSEPTGRYGANPMVST